MYKRQYEGCTGLKTGYTSTAMYCLAASAEREGTEYVAVIMHAESVESRNRDYYVKAEDMKNLLPDWEEASGCIATNRITCLLYTSLSL